jgi:hypothetical protein
MFSKNKRKVKQRNYYNPFYMFGYLSVGDGGNVTILLSRQSEITLYNYSENCEIGKQPM